MRIGQVIIVHIRRKVIRLNQKQLQLVQLLQVLMSSLSLQQYINVHPDIHVLVVHVRKIVNVRKQLLVQ